MIKLQLLQIRAIYFLEWHNQHYDALVCVFHSNMSHQIVEYYFERQNIREKPDQILKDSVLMSIVFDGMSPGLLASYPEFVALPISNEDHVRNYVIMQKALQSYGVDTQEMQKSVSSAVRCMTVALLLGHSTVSGASGLFGLKEFVSEVLQNYNIEFDGIFTNDVTSRVLYYAYSYLSDSPADIEGFSRGLEKDGIPILFNNQSEDEERNLYQTAYIYNLVHSAGRPMFMIRQLAAKITAQQKGESLEAQMLEFQHQCAKTNKMAYDQLQNISQINQLTIIEAISAQIQQLFIQTKEDQTNFLVQIEQLVRGDIDIQLLKEQGYIPKDKHFNISVDHFIQSFSETFGDAREALYHIFEVCAQIQSFDMLQEVVIQIDQDNSQKLKEYKEQLSKSQENLKDNLIFIQTLHKLFIDHRNALLHSYTHEFIQIIKQYLNEHKIQSFELTITEIPELDIQDILLQFTTYVVKLVQKDTHTFLAEYLQLQFDELMEVLNSKVSVNDKEMLLQQVNDNVPYYQAILNQVRDYKLQEQLNAIKELVRSADASTSETPLRLQYKNQAAECYNTIVQLLQKAQVQLFAENNIPMDQLTPREKEFTLADYKQQLSNIMERQQTQKLTVFSYQELNQLLNKQTHFYHIIGGLQMLKLQQYQSVDLSHVQLLLQKITELDQQIKKRGENSQNDYLSLNHLVLMKDFIDQINKIQSNSKYSAQKFMEISSNFIEMLVQLLQTQIGDLTVINDKFETIKEKLGEQQDIDEIKQHTREENLKESLKQAYGVYKQLCEIRDILYHPNTLITSDNVPEIQKRFGQLLQMLLCDVFKTGLGPRTSLSLFGLVQKLITQYNDLVSQVQKQLYGLQEVLAVLSESTIMYDSIENALITLKNIINGLMIYKGALRCPIYYPNSKQKTLRMELTNFNSFISDVFSGKLNLSDIVKQIEAKSITFEVYDKEEAEKFVSQQLSNAAACKVLIESAIACFDLLVQQFPEKTLHQYKKVINNYKSEISEVLYAFMNVYEEMSLDQTDGQSFQDISRSAMGVSGLHKQSENRIMTVTDIINKTRKPIEHLNAKTADQAVTWIINQLETIKSYFDNNQNDNSLLAMFRAKYTLQLLHSLEGEAQTLLEQCKQCGLDPRETGQPAGIQDAVREYAGYVIQKFNEFKVQAVEEINKKKQEYAEINKIHEILSTIFSGRQIYSDLDQFNVFQPFIAKLKSSNNSKACPSLLLSQMKSMRQTNIQKGNLNPGQQLLNVFQNFCRRLSEIQVQVQRGEASPKQIGDLLITIQLFECFNPYIEMLSCYDSDQEIYNNTQRIQNHCKEDLKILEMQGNQIKNKSHKRILSGLKSIWSFLNNCRGEEHIYVAQLENFSNNQQTIEFLKLENQLHKLKIKVKTFKLTQTDKCKIKQLINELTDSAEQAKILQKFQNLSQFEEENENRQQNIDSTTFYQFIGENPDRKDEWLLFSSCKGLGLYSDQHSELQKYFNEVSQEITSSPLYKSVINGQNIQGISKYQIQKINNINIQLKEVQNTINQYDKVIKDLNTKIKSSEYMYKFANGYDKAIKDIIKELHEIVIPELATQTTLQEIKRKLSKIYGKIIANTKEGQKQLRVRASYSSGIFCIPETLLNLLYKIKELQVSEELNYLSKRSVPQLSEQLNNIINDLKTFIENIKQQEPDDENILDMIQKVCNEIVNVGTKAITIKTMFSSNLQQYDVYNCVFQCQELIKQLQEVQSIQNITDKASQFIVQLLNNTIIASNKLKCIFNSKVSLLEGWHQACDKINIDCENSEVYEETNIDENHNLYSIVQDIKQQLLIIDHLYQQDYNANSQVIEENIEIRKTQKQILDIVGQKQIEAQLWEIKEFINNEVFLEYINCLQQSEISIEEVNQQVICILVRLLKRLHSFKIKVIQILEQYLYVVEQKGIGYNVWFSNSEVLEITSTLCQFMERINTFINIISLINIELSNSNKLAKYFTLESNYEEEVMKEHENKLNTSSCEGEGILKALKQIYQNDLDLIIVSAQHGKLNEIKKQYNNSIKNMNEQLKALREIIQNYFDTNSQVGEDLIKNIAVRWQVDLELNVESKANQALQFIDIEDNNGISDAVEMCNRILSDKNQYTAIYNSMVYANKLLLGQQPQEDVKVLRINLEVYPYLVNKLQEVNASACLMEFYKELEQCAATMLQSGAIYSDIQEYQLSEQNGYDISSVIDNKIETSEQYQDAYQDIQEKLTQMHRNIEQTAKMVHKQLQYNDIQGISVTQATRHTTFISNVNYCLVICVEMLSFLKVNNKHQEISVIEGFMKQLLQFAQESQNIESGVLGFELQHQLQLHVQESLDLVNEMTTQQLSRCQQFAQTLENQISDEKEQQILHLLRLSIFSLQTFKELQMQFILLRKELFGSLTLEKHASAQNSYTEDLIKVYNDQINLYLSERAKTKIPMYALLQNTYNDINPVIMTENNLKQLCNVQVQIASDQTINEPAVQITELMQENLASWLKNLNHSMQSIIDSHCDMSINVLFKSFFIQTKVLEDIINKHCSENQEYQELYDLLKVSEMRLEKLKQIHGDMLGHTQFINQTAMSISSSQMQLSTSQEQQKKNLIISLQQLNDEIVNEIKQIIQQVMPALTAIQVQGGCNQQLCLNEFVQQQLNVLNKISQSLDQLNNSISISQETQLRLSIQQNFVQPLKNPFFLQVYVMSVEAAIYQALRTPSVDLKNTIAHYKNFEFASINKDINTCKRAIYALLKDAIQLSAFPQLQGERSDMETSEYRFDRYQWNFYDILTGGAVIQYKNVQQLLGDVNKMVNQVVYIQNEQFSRKSDVLNSSGDVSAPIQALLRHARTFCTEVECLCTESGPQQWQLLQFAKLQPRLHSLALRGAILASFTAEAAAALDLHGERSILPEIFGFFEQKSLYTIVLERKFKCVVSSLRNLNKEVAESTRSIVSVLLSDVNSAVSTLKRIVEQNSLQTLKDLLRHTNVQNQFVSRRLAHQQILTVLSTVFFIDKPSIFNKLATVATEISKLNNNDIKDSFSIEMAKLFERYISADLLENHDQSTRWGQLLVSKFISESLTAIFNKINKENQAEMAKIPADGVFPYFTIPVALQGDGNQYGDHIVKNRTLLSFYEHADTLGPIIKKFCISGMKTFKLTQETDNLIFLGNKAFVEEMNKLKLKEKNVKLFELDDLSSVQNEWQKQTETIMEKLAEVQLRLVEQSDANKHKFAQETFLAKSQLYNFLTVYKHMQAFTFLDLLVSYYHHAELFDNQLKMNLAAHEYYLKQSRPLELIIQQEIEIIERISMIIGEKEAEALINLQKKLTNLTNIIQPINKQLTDIESRYMADFSLIRIIAQAWRAAGFPPCSILSLQRVLDIAGETIQSYNIDNTTTFDEGQNFIMTACSVINKDPSALINANNMTALTGDDLNELALTCQVVLGTKCNETCIQ